MKKIIFIVLLFLTTNSFAQVNLVLNPSFEDTFACPQFDPNTSFAKYWSAIVDTNYTADTNNIYQGIQGYLTSDANCFPYYCNICSSDADASLPNNGWFTHYPRTGNGLMFVGIYAQAGGGGGYCRQYLQGRLFTTLVAGQSYCVTFYVVNAQISAMGSNHIGVYFDDGTIDTVTECGHAKTFVTPQYQTDSIIADTTNWHKISFNYVATGTEKFITLGNFNDSAHTDVLYFNSTGEYNYAWYLFDDVSVIASNTHANAGVDKLIAVGDSTAIGLDSAANGVGMPCYWYVLGGTSPIDSGGTIMVHPMVNTSYVVELDLCGTLTYDTVLVQVFPLKNAMVKMSTINIFPNPATNILNIENAENCEVYIYDIVGNINAKIKMQKTLQSIDISKLATGVYFVEAVDEETGMKVVRRVVKE